MLPILILIAASLQSPTEAEALSWQARQALARNDLNLAAELAERTYEFAKGKDISRDAHLQIALGAAIEVHAQVLARQGRGAEAVTYLREQEKVFHATPIRTRIQKNLNLLSLEGKPAPPLDSTHWLGAKPPSTKGRPFILFFWAHWCGDCKAEAPLLSALAKDVLVIAPTQPYGYTPQSETVSAAEETKYIDQVRARYYAGWPVPLSEENFRKYGASTTPTMVFVDRRGIVRLYHPGAMTPDELRAALAKLAN